MKVAVVTDDGTTISQHFGQARYYAVLTIENQQAVGKTLIDRTPTLHPPAEHQPRHGLSGETDCHGTGAAAAAWHERMVKPIADCQVLLTGGMSWSMRECLAGANIRPIITDIADIEGALRAFLDGSIVDRVERLH